jgi:hypothetical protein
VVPRNKKRHILDEFCANCGCHCKYAIPLAQRSATRGQTGTAGALAAKGELWGTGDLDFASGWDWRLAFTKPYRF